MKRGFGTVCFGIALRIGNIFGITRGIWAPEELRVEKSTRALHRWSAALGAALHLTEPSAYFSYYLLLNLKQTKNFNVENRRERGGFFSLAWFCSLNKHFLSRCL